MMGGPSGGGRTGMKKTGLLKRAGVAVMTAALMVTAVACNTKIKVNFEAKASDYVKLGQYKGITVSVDEQAIENELIEKKVQNDLTSNTTYDEVSREARDKDQVTVDFTGTIGGEEVSGFSNEDYSLILGTDTFVIDGFIDALYGMSAGQTKVVILTVPEDFEDAPEYAGSRIVYNITMKKVEQPNVPMITDAYVQEYFSCNTVAEYRQSIKDEIKQLNEELDRISSTTQFNKQDLLTGGFSGKLQVGALEGQTMDVKISLAVSAKGLNVSAVEVSTNVKAGAAMQSIQDAIESVSKQRSKLGAIQNRLEHTINNLDTNAENTQAAESRIRDTDMADEMVQYSKNNILSQAGQSMLTQANQQTQGVLSLLQ